MKNEWYFPLLHLLSHILPRRSAMERRSGWSTYKTDGFDWVSPMPGPVAMNKRRAR